MTSVSERAGRGALSVQTGLFVNAILAVIKLLAGVIGHSYALIADSLESSLDVLASLVVRRGLRLSVRAADERYPFGYGKAEPMAAAVVALLLLGGAVGIAIQAVREILTPHHGPALFTLPVLLIVVAIKEVLYRRISVVGEAVESAAVRADAWHHRSDALTSGAAAVGIAIAVIGGPEWAAADDWAALAAAGVILINGLRILHPAAQDLMDRTPGPEVEEQILRAATALPDVRAVETLKVRRAGLGLFVDIHVEADPEMPLREAHVVSGKVKTAIRGAVPAVIGVLVHMEPHEGSRTDSRFQEGTSPVSSPPSSSIPR